MRRQLFHLILLAVLGMAAMSCDRRPLEETFETGAYADILLVTDWSKLEDPNFTGMTAIFYPTDGGTPTRITSNNTERNVVRLRRGSYHILVFNQSETEFGSMTFDGMGSLFTAEAMLKPLESGNESTADDYNWFYGLSEVKDSGFVAYREPEYLNAQSIKEYDVTDAMTKEYARQTATGETFYADTIYMTPPPVVPTLHITISVKGIENCRSIKAYITDMAESQLLGAEQNSSKSACQVISHWTRHISESDPTVGAFTADIRTFGVPGMYIYGNATVPAKATRASSITTENILNRLRVFFNLRDGKTMTPYSWDVTEKMSYAQAELRLDITLDQGTKESGETGPIILPDVDDDGKTDTGAGFDATVEDWDNKDEHIQI